MGTVVRLVFARVDEGADKFVDYALGRHGVDAMAISGEYLTIKCRVALISHPICRVITLRYEPVEGPHG